MICDKFYWLHGVGKDLVLEEIPKPELDTTNDFAEWKADGTCSKCGVYSSLNKAVTYFCPNCGADMRVKNDLNRVNKELNIEPKDSHAEYWNRIGEWKGGDEK